jgi:hypothetical protein
MKTIFTILGGCLLLATAGCEWDEHHHHDEYRGGAYDGDYHNGYFHDYRGYPDYEHYPDVH